MTNLEQLAQQLVDSGEYRVLRRLQQRHAFCDDDGSEKRIAIYADSETTGLQHETCDVINLAMLKFEYSPVDGRIFRVLDVFDELNQPRQPIPAEITRLTGITDQMVEGRRLDSARIAEFVSPAVLVISHNAKFDRPFCEGISPCFAGKHWACTAEQVRWREYGLESSKLEWLAYRFGFFYGGHRASADCWAGLEVMSRSLPDGRRVLKALLDEARQPIFRIRVTRPPMHFNQAFKARSYCWRPVISSWIKDTRADQVAEEITWIQDTIYGGNDVDIPVTKLSPLERFSQRE